MQKTHFEMKQPHIPYISPEQYYIIQPFPKQAPVFMCRQYKSFENMEGKGVIALNEQFLLFPRVFTMLFENFLPFS